MRFMFLVVFLCLSNNSKEGTSCSTFKDLGIKSVCLKIDKTIFLKSNIFKVEKNKSDYENLGYENFSCVEEFKIGNKIKEIRYFFVFKNENLVSYSFEFIGNRELFKELSVTLNKSQLDLIKSNFNRVRYSYSNENLIKHFSITYRYGLNQYITGGEKLIDMNN